MKKIIDVINTRLVGKVFNTSELEKIIENNPIYLDRLENEVEKISNSNPNRSYLDVYKRTLQGHIAEIILLEDEEIGSMLERAKKKYHDLYVKDENCFLEVKNFNPATLESKVQSWLSVDAIEYNTSKYLVVFEYSKTTLTLSKAIEVDRRVVPNMFSVNKSGKTYTITENMLRHLKKDTLQPIAFISETRKVLKDVEWFLTNCNPSKFNNGTYFVFDSQL